MFISIVIPCHNCAQTIDRAVNSVLSQTHKEWELILVNNNSVDHTWEKLNEIKKQHPEKAITILNEDKKGAPAARNKGLYVAKGEWVQFLDSDDELLPEKIEKQLFSIKGILVDVVYSPYYKVKAGHENIISIEKNFLAGLITSNMGITSANFFRKAAVLSVGGWDETKTSSQEYDLMFRIAENGGVFLAFEEPLALIHYQENSISNKKDSAQHLKRLNSFSELRTKIIIFIKDNNLLNQEYQELYDKAISKAFVMNFRESPLQVFSLFNKITKISYRAKIKTNWAFFKLTIRIFFKILPE